MDAESATGCLAHVEPLHAGKSELRGLATFGSDPKAPTSLR